MFEHNHHFDPILAGNLSFESTVDITGNISLLSRGFLIVFFPGF